MARKSSVARKTTRTPRPDILDLPDNCVRDPDYVRFDHDHRMVFGQLEAGEVLVGKPTYEIRCGTFKIENLRLTQPDRRRERRDTVAFSARTAGSVDQVELRLLEVWCTTSNGRTVGRLIHVRDRTYLTKVFVGQEGIQFAVIAPQVWWLRRAAKALRIDPSCVDRATKQRIAERAGFNSARSVDSWLKVIPNELENWMLGGEAPDGWRIISEAELLHISKAWDINGHCLVVAHQVGTNRGNVAGQLVKFLRKIPSQFRKAMVRMALGGPEPPGLMCTDKSRQQLIAKGDYHLETARNVGEKRNGVSGKMELERMVRDHMDCVLPKTAGKTNRQSGIVDCDSQVGFCILSHYFPHVRSVARCERPNGCASSLASLREDVGDEAVDAFMLASISAQLMESDDAHARKAPNEVYRDYVAARNRVLANLNGSKTRWQRVFRRKMTDAIKKVPAPSRVGFTLHLCGKATPPPKMFQIENDVYDVRLARSDTSILNESGAAFTYLWRWRKENGLEYRLYQEMRRTTFGGGRFEEEQSESYQLLFGTIRQQPWNIQGKLLQRRQPFLRLLGSFDWGRSLVRAGHPEFELDAVLDDAEQKCGEWGRKKVEQYIENELAGCGYDKHGVTASRKSGEFIIRFAEWMVLFRAACQEIRPQGFTVDELLDLKLITPDDVAAHEAAQRAREADSTASDPIAKQDAVEKMQQRAERSKRRVAGSEQVRDLKTVDDQATMPAGNGQADDVGNAVLQKAAYELLCESPADEAIKELSATFPNHPLLPSDKIEVLQLAISHTGKDLEASTWAMYHDIYWYRREGIALLEIVKLRPSIKRKENIPGAVNRYRKVFRLPQPTPENAKSNA